MVINTGWARVTRQQSDWIGFIVFQSKSHFQLRQHHWNTYLSSNASIWTWPWATSFQSGQPGSWPICPARSTSTEHSGNGRASQKLEISQRSSDISSLEGIRAFKLMFHVSAHGGQSEYRTSLASHVTFSPFSWGAWATAQAWCQNRRITSNQDLFRMRKFHEVIWSFFLYFWLSASKYVKGQTGVHQALAFSPESCNRNRCSRTGKSIPTAGINSSTFQDITCSVMYMTPMIISKLASHFGTAFAQLPGGCSACELPSLVLHKTVSSHKPASK